MPTHNSMWNDYISKYLWIYLCNLLYYACMLICFYRRRLYLCFHFMFCVLGNMLWICDTWIFMSTFLKDLSWFFHNFLSFLCSISRVSSESDPSHRDRSVSVPAELAASPRLWIMMLTQTFDDEVSKKVEELRDFLNQVYIQYLRAAQRKEWLMYLATEQVEG